MQYKALFVAPNRVRLGLVAAKGAKYTRSRLPVDLVYYEEYETSREAQSREAKIKRLSRKEKMELIKNESSN